jgi:class 3 adenylate cyclase/tetratricopeptide (TPR) repeat protein
VGSSLFADISGFTPLTEQLARTLGPLRGAEEVTRYLRQIYDALIAEVHRFGGSVIGFSGDAITCWFDGDPGRRAVAAALEMQRAMAPFTTVELPGGGSSGLAVKVAVAAGPVRRFVVGDPDIRRIDVLAGSTLMRLAALEGLSERGEVVVDPAIPDLERDFEVAERRHEDGVSAAVVAAARSEVPPSPWPAVDAAALGPDRTRTWLLPAVFDRASRGSEALLANFRPAAALFLSFQGIDYDGDESAGERLDAFVRWVQQRVADLEGSIIQLTIGDKGSYLYAAFGAPITHDDDASRAVAAALQLREPPPEFGIEQIRIGLSHGQMYTGTYGSGTRKTYGVLGDKTNLAARLMGKAEIGQILCDPDLVAVTRAQWRFETLPPIRVKGKTDPIAVAAAQGERSRRDGGAGQDRPLVGRDGDLMRLQALLAQVQRGRPRITEFVGEAGIGKSRLVREIARVAREGGAGVLEGAGQSVRQQVPYWIWRDVLRALFDLSDDAPPELQRAKVERHLERILPQLLDRLPLLDDVLALGFAETPFSAALDAGLRQENLGQLLVALLHHEAGSRPLLLILDDAHWLDSLSWELAERVARSLSGDDLPLWLMLLERPQDPSRPDPHDAVRRQIATRSEIFRLSPLGPQGLRALLAERLDCDAAALPVALAKLVEERSGGNPFFAEQLLGTLREQGLLGVVRDGSEVRFEVAEALERGDMALPNTLQGLILSRIDRLALATPVVIKVAAVIGLRFGQAVLRVALSAAESADVDLLKPVAELERAGMIRRESEGTDPSYAFSHILTHEVVYQTLLFAQRRILHRAVAGWYETSYRDRLDEVLPTLAYHFRQGVGRGDEPELIARAVEVLWRAGERDGRLGAYHEALEVFADALAMLPGDGDWSGKRADLLIRSGEVQEKVGDYPAATLSFEEALERGREAGERPLEVRSLNGLCLVGTRQGAYEAAREAGEEALALAQSIGDDIGTAGARSRLGILAFYGGDLEAAEGHFAAALELYRDLDDAERTSSALNSLGMVATVRETYDQADHYFEGALDLAREIQDRNATGKYLANLGLVAEKREDFEAAAERYRESLDLFREIGARQDAVINLFNLGLVEFNQGRDEAARRYHLEALAQALDLGALPVALGGLIGIAGVEARLGNVERAAELLGLALSHPASNAEVEENAGAIVDLVRGALDADEVEAHMAVGSGRDLVTVARELQGT